MDISSNKPKEYERCLRCNRKLKNASTRMRGMGDVCYQKYLAESSHKKLFPRR